MDRTSGRNRADACCAFGIKMMNPMRRSRNRLSNRYNNLYGYKAVTERISELPFVLSITFLML